MRYFWLFVTVVQFVVVTIQTAQGDVHILTVGMLLFYLICYFGNRIEDTVIRKTNELKKLKQ